MGLIAGRRHGRDRADDTIGRFALRWALALALLIGAFACTVTALNATLYSAQGFVGGYLGALARHDIATALATPGVEIADADNHALLTGDALGTIGDVRLTSVSRTATGDTHLVYRVTLDGTVSEAAFDVHQTSARLGFFSSWAFATSPTSTIEVTPVSDPDFEANGFAVTSAAGANVPVSYTVLTPGVFSLSHESQYLVADPQSVFVPTPADTARVSITSKANPAFVKLVQKELDATLLACTAQTVLQPAGCPFGEAIDNRVEGDPVWTMTTYPAITIVPGGVPGTWVVPEATGAAHLKVGVQSLFDGTSSVFDRDIPFTVSYLITMETDGSLDISAE